MKIIVLKNIEITATQQQQQQYHHCCPTEGGGITYPEIIQNSSINNTYDTQFYNRDWQPNTMDLSQPPDENLSRSRSSSSSLKSNPRKMSRKSSASSSRRSTISVPYNIPDMIPFNQQQQITELDSENSLSMVPKPNDTIYNGGLGGLTDPDELSFLLNNILMNRDESEKLGSLDMTRSTTTTSSTCSMPCIASPQGESVVITITPLSSSDMPVSRIVTCYCGSSCTCPGCFVHPTNYDKLLAPTNNQIISLPQPLTSCSSDEENPIY